MSIPKLSILILTHNRPKLFERCINSILQFKFSFNIEVLVNNDSKDIQEIYSDSYPIRYSYYSNNNLGYLYKHLFDLASGEYIYFLEDDDYLSSSFVEHLVLDSSLIYMNYKPAKLEDRLLQLTYRNNFKIETTNDLFQLSQIIFKKELLPSFPSELLNNHLDNDWKLFQILKQSVDGSDGKITLIKKQMFIQTCDGLDNISFPEHNKDERFLNNTTVKN
jgi:glycosyltransferase involved in cell wall biosynthesis